MKISNAIRKLEKAGFTVEATHTSRGSERMEAGTATEWRASHKDSSYVVEFIRNGCDDAITCIRTKRPNEKDDSMTDYFPGQWHDNITQAIKSAMRHPADAPRARPALHIVRG